MVSRIGRIDTDQWVTVDTSRWSDPQSDPQSDPMDDIRAAKCEFHRQFLAVHPYPRIGAKEADRLRLTLESAEALAKHPVMFDLEHWHTGEDCWCLNDTLRLPVFLRGLELIVDGS